MPLPKLALGLTLLLVSYTILIGLFFSGSLISVMPRYAGSFSAISDASFLLLFALPLSALILAALASSANADGIFMPKSETSKHQVWLWVHGVYQLLAMLDPFLFVALVGLVSRSIAGTNGYVEFFFFGSFVYALSFVYRSAILQIFGVSHDKLTTPPIQGAASYAELARSIFDNPNQASRNSLVRAMRYLEGSLTALLISLTSDSVQLPSLNKTRAIVGLMTERSDLETLDLNRLSLLSQNLAKLPRLEDLPISLSRFLHDFPWTEELDAVPTRAFHWSDRLAVFAAILSGIATVVAAMAAQLGGLANVLVNSPTIVPLVAGIGAMVTSAYLVRPLLRCPVVLSYVLRVKSA